MLDMDELESGSHGVWVTCRFALMKRAKNAHNARLLLCSLAAVAAVALN